MGNGRRGKAPCGHEGEAIVGQYYKCLHGCDDKRIPAWDDTDAVPIEITLDEHTQPICQHCGSNELQVYPGMGMNGHQLYHCKKCSKASLV